MFDKDTMFISHESWTNQTALQRFLSMSARESDGYQRMARAVSQVPLRLPRPRAPLCETPRPLPLLPDDLSAWLGDAETNKKGSTMQILWIIRKETLAQGRIQGFS